MMRKFVLTLLAVLLVATAGGAGRAVADDFADPAEVVDLFFEALWHGEAETAYAFVYGEEPDKIPFYDFLLWAYDVSYIDLSYYQPFLAYMGRHTLYEYAPLNFGGEKVSVMATISMPDGEDYFERRRELGANFAEAERPALKVRQQIFRLVNQNGAWRIAVLVN